MPRTTASAQTFRRVTWTSSPSAAAAKVVAQESNGVPGALFGIASCDPGVAISRGQAGCGGNEGVRAQGLAQRSALDAIARGAFTTDAATLCASFAASASIVASAALGGMGQSCQPIATANRGREHKAHRVE